MSPENLRQQLDSKNIELKDELEEEAREARKKLISYARSYIFMLLNHDLETMLDGTDSVIYTQLHDRSEDQGVDAYDSHDTLSAHWQKATKNKQGSPSSEIFIHLPLTHEATKAYQDVLSSIVAGVDRKEITILMERLIESIQTMDIDAINIHHIVNHPSGAMANIKHVTPFGSIDYKSFSKGHIAEHLEEFEVFIDKLPGSDLGLEEVLSGAAPEMHYVRPDIKTDINYINDLRADLANMRLVPQKQIA